jgi:hypothetical protein
MCLPMQTAMTLGLARLSLPCPPSPPLGPCAHLRTPQDCLAYPTNECFWGESRSRHMEPRTRSMIPLGEGEWLLQRVVMTPLRWEGR